MAHLEFIWPDLEGSLAEAILTYNRRHRRFGRIWRKYDSGFAEKNLVCRGLPGYFPTNLMIWWPLAIRMAVGILNHATGHA